MATLETLVIYPVKGCRGQVLESADVTTQGLAGDRVFTVLMSGQRTNQKQIPALRELGATWRGTDLELAYPGAPDFTLDTRQSNAGGEEGFRGGRLPSLDMGDDVAAWLSSALGERDVRLGKQAGVTPFILPHPDFDGVHGEPQDRYVDAAPLLVTFTASLDDLNTRLDAPVTMDRFRPNLVMSGTRAYQEDNIVSLALPGVTVKTVVDCERCGVVTVDPANGDTSKEPLKTLAKYRRRENDYAGGVVFGLYATVTGAGRIATGEVAELILR